MVVEDNRDAADTLRMLLEMMGHEVRVAYTGPDGVRAGRGVAAGRGGVRYLDLPDPGRLRRGPGPAAPTPATARTRLIAVTGYGSEDDRRQARESGFDHLLTKPADPAVLQQLLVAPG